MHDKETLFTFRKRLNITFLTIFLLTSINSVLCFLVTYKGQDNFSSIQTTRTHQENIHRISLDLQAAERGQRGYILTGKRSYLEPYLVAKSHLRPDLRTLNVDMSDKTQGQRVENLSMLSGLKMAEMQKTIDLMDQGKPQDALNIVLQGDGERYMNRIGVVLDTMQVQEQRSLTAQQEEWQRVSTDVTWTFGLIVPMTFTLLLWMSRRLRMRFEEGNELRLETESVLIGLAQEAEVQRESMLRAEEKLQHEVQQRQDRDKAIQAEVLLRQKFLVDVLYSVTDGRFHLCHDQAEIPSHGTPLIAPRAIKADNLSACRHALADAVKALQYPQLCIDKVLSASGEAMMNAVLHGANGRLEARLISGVLHVTVIDDGKGIDISTLPSAVLQSGYSGLGRQSLGMGFTVILSESDEVFLKTGADGTTVSMVFYRDGDPVRRFQDMLVMSK